VGQHGKPRNPTRRVFVLGNRQGAPTWDVQVSKAASLSDLSVSSVKRYARIAEREVSLAPRKSGGRPPRRTGLLEEAARKGHEGASRGHHLRKTLLSVQSATGKGFSIFTVPKAAALNRVGYGTGRVAKSYLERSVATKGVDPKAVSLRGRDADYHLAVGAWAASWIAGVLPGAAQPRGKRTPPCQHERGGGYGTFAVGVKRATAAAIFEAYHVSPILPSSHVFNEQKLISAHRFVRQRF